MEVRQCYPSLNLLIWNLLCLIDYIRIKLVAEHPAHTSQEGEIRPFPSLLIHDEPLTDVDERIAWGRGSAPSQNVFALWISQVLTGVCLPFFPWSLQNSFISLIKSSQAFFDEDIIIFIPKVRKLGFWQLVWLAHGLAANKSQKGLKIQSLIVFLKSHHSSECISCMQDSDTFTLESPFAFSSWIEYNKLILGFPQTN